MKAEGNWGLGEPLVRTREAISQRGFRDSASGQNKAKARTVTCRIGPLIMAISKVLAQVADEPGAPDSLSDGRFRARKVVSLPPLPPFDEASSGNCPL